MQIDNNNHLTVESNQSKRRERPVFLTAEQMSNASTAEESKESISEYRPCEKMCWCGHACKGVDGETDCLQCLKPECRERLTQVALECVQDDNDRLYAESLNLINAGEDELCGICFTSELGSDPCVRLGCRHVFHAECLSQMLTHRYNTLKITFGYLDCPSCKQQIQLPYYVPALTEKLRENHEFMDKVTI